MNAKNSLPPRDDEIDLLLARQYRDTTPEFEARWVAMKRELRSAPPPRRWSRWSGWVGLLATGSIAAMVLVLSLTRNVPMPAKPADVDGSVVAELMAMDEVLGRGRILLNVEDRDVLLHLSVQPQTRN